MQLQAFNEERLSIAWTVQNQKCYVSYHALYQAFYQPGWSSCTFLPAGTFYVHYKGCGKVAKVVELWAKWLNVCPVMVYFTVLRFNWIHNEGNLFLKSILRIQGGPLLGILHMQVYIPYFLVRSCWFPNEIYRGSVEFVESSIGVKKHGTCHFIFT